MTNKTPCCLLSLLLVGTKTEIYMEWAFIASYLVSCLDDSAGKWPINDYSCLAQKCLQKQPFSLDQMNWHLMETSATLPLSGQALPTSKCCTQEIWSNADTENIRNKSHKLWNTHSNRLQKRKEQHVHLISGARAIPGGSFSRRWRGAVINVCILLSKTLQSHCVQIRLELNYSSRHEPTEHRHIQMGRHV